MDPILTTIIQGAARPFKWWVTIASWEQGLRVRFGKRSRALPPGIHFRIPFLDRVYVQSTRAKTIVSSNQTMSTADGKVVTMSVSIIYEVSDILRMYEQASSPEDVLIFEALKVAAHEVSSRRVADLSPLQIGEAISARLQSVDLGLSNVSSALTGFCVSRCYRIIDGSGWQPQGRDLDKASDSGERN